METIQGKSPRGVWMVLNESVSRRRGIGAGLRPVAAIGALVGLELLALGGARSAWRVVRAPGPASLEEAVLVVVLAACVLLAGWLVVSTTIACAAHLPGRLGDRARRWSRTVAPAATRRVAALLVGAAVGATLAPGTATASVGGLGGPGAPAGRSPGFVLTLPAPSPSPSAPTPAAPEASATAASVTAPSVTAPSVTAPSVTAPSVTAPSVTGPGWTPSRPVHPPAPVARLVTGPSAPASTEVVVHRGDSLWTIARRHLGPGATDTEVAAAWPHWYAANRDVIGPDPDLLRPGQRLRAPVGAHP